MNTVCQLKKLALKRKAHLSETGTFCSGILEQFVVFVVRSNARRDAFVARHTKKHLAPPGDFPVSPCFFSKTPFIFNVGATEHGA